MADIAIAQSNREFHLNKLAKTPSELDMADQGPLREEYPASWAILADKGYQGLHRNLRAITPTKRPAGGVLTVSEMDVNDKIASDRVIIEIFFGRLKTLWSVVGDTFKWKRDNYDIYFQSCVAFTNVHIRFMPLRAEDGHDLHRLVNGLISTGQKKKAKRAGSVAMSRDKRKRRLSAMYANGETFQLSAEMEYDESEDGSSTMRTNAVKVGREDLTATVDGVVPVRASLLDSGADLSVASGGLVSALLAAGAAPEIIVMGPTTLRPYGTDSRPITVTKQVRLGRLEFNTGCGPLMLRGLRVWIDEAEAAVELTLGLPVMQKLGYSEQTLLENARRQQAVWDFADQPDTTPGIAMHRTLRMEELSDGIDDDEGMCCATPELGMIPSLADAEAVGLLTHEYREGPVNLIHLPSATHSAACLTTRPIWCGAHQIRRTGFSAIATMRVTS
ncbi:hypothetical protein DYB36_001509 [Aphanomyces astaci]|uniref:DDE Tnp4 domain-containing protein n=1 Tax=Aphanomyces astaci TaxID=112090 RepID=A0A397AYS8_APHAT|nr:hypothetical protein DYB36_001509 [Aphanomyces astaci]